MSALTNRLTALAIVAIPFASGVAFAETISTICHTFTHTVKKTVHHTKVVHAKPKPPVEVIRYVSSPCAPMGIQTPPVNTAFTIEDQDIPWLAGATRNPPSNYRIDYGYPVAPVTGTTPPSSVPEPASWAMMVAGFGFVGGVMRRRKGVLA